MGSNQTEVRIFSNLVSEMASNHFSRILFIGSKLDFKAIQPVHPKRDQSCVFIGRTDVEAKTPILWPPHAKS